MVPKICQKHLKMISKNFQIDLSLLFYKKKKKKRIPSWELKIMKKHYPNLCLVNKQMD